jgi:hypothetical protein
MRNRQPVWYEFVTIALGIPIVHWSLAVVTLLVLLWLLCGCCHSDTWGCKELRDPLHLQSGVWLEDSQKR